MKYFDTNKGFVTVNTCVNYQSPTTYGSKGTSKDWGGGMSQGEWVKGHSQGHLVMPLERSLLQGIHIKYETTTSCGSKSYKR